MKNIYFVQVNNSYGTDVKNIYIPYAVGCIEAYCKQSKEICENYDFKTIIYYRMSQKDFMSRIEEPFAVFFSCSVWNYEYNKVMAQSIKKEYPFCYIVFGGHSVSPNADDLNKYSYVDFLTHRFGEESTKALLLELIGNMNFYSIPNISFRDSDTGVVTTHNVPQKDEDYPSPYLEGIFDDILNDGFAFSAILETNRGCPNSCSYCDWGSLKSKVRLIPMKRVKEEIGWFVKHKIEFVFCADGNFCLFPRDKEIAEYVVECKKKYGYPKIFRVCFTKNKLDMVYEIGTMFLSNGLDKAQTLSFQSMNEEALKNIGRKNISTEMFKQLMKKYNSTNVATFSELILGLPGETYETFCSGVSTLLNGGQHFSFMVYPCELLPNSEMAQKWYIEKYKIKSTKVPFKLVHTIDGESEEITEYGDYVTSTYSMNTSDWIRSLIFSKYVQALHCLGLLRAVAIFYRYECGIDYDVFYNKFIEFSKEKSSGVLNAVYNKINKLCQGVILLKNEFVTTCDLTENMLWDFDEFVFLEFYKEFDEFYQETEKFLKSIAECKYSDEIIKYQKNIIKKLNQKEIEISSKYNFYDYFNSIFLGEYTPLKKERCIMKITDKKCVNSFFEFAKEVVWYGRNKRCSDYSSPFYDVQIIK